MTTETRAFGRYELRGVLGHGGFATVYRAFDPALQREVALKALLPHLAAEQEIRGRFVAEARALAALHHPNIVTVYDVGEADGLPFFAMELIEGSTLAAWLASGAPPIDRALLWLSNLASALDYLHAAGLVHRDIKPANIMIAPSGQAVLMDFGVARSLDGTQHTQTGVSLGTPAFMSPEQVRGQPAGPAADIYALGILAFALLTGHAPFHGDTAAVLHAQVYDPPPLAGLPPVYAAALDRALAKEPALRPASAEAFVATLRGEIAPDATLPAYPAHGNTPPPVFEQPYPTGPYTPSPVTPIPPRGGLSARAAGLLGGALAVIVLLVATIVIVLTHRPSPPPVPPTTVVFTQAPTATSAATSSAAPAPSVAAVSATAARANPTQQPSAPTSAPTAVAPFTAASPVIDSNDVAAWASGSSALTARVAFQNAPESAALLLRIAPAGDPGHPVSQGNATPLGAPNGTVMLSAPAVGVVPGGNYVALVYDTNWNQVQSYSLAVAPPPAPPTIVRPTQPPAPPTMQTQALPAAPNLNYPADAGANSPEPQIVQVMPLGAPSQGRFSFRVVATNVGRLSGGTGSISASSPDAVGFSSGIPACDMSAKSAALPPGSGISVFNGRGFNTEASVYPLVEAEMQSWPPGAQCTLDVTMSYAPSATSVTLYLRSTVFAADSSVSTWPGTAGTKDQQNLPVVVWTVPLH